LAGEKEGAVEEVFPPGWALGEQRRASSVISWHCVRRGRCDRPFVVREAIMPPGGC
jgi:hypothetical protein